MHIEIAGLAETFLTLMSQLKGRKMTLKSLFWDFRAKKAKIFSITRNFS